MDAGMNRLGAALVALGLLVTGTVAAQDGEPGPRRRRNREKPAGGAGLIEKAEAIQKEVEAIRGLKLRAPVAKGVKTVDELKSHFRESFDKEVAPEEFAKQEKVAKRFHLLPDGYDLRAEFLALLGDQVAGFYDPDTKQLFCIDRAPEAGGGGMGIDMNELTMAHELEHAIQDQTFDLRKRTWLLNDEEDRSLAYRCVVEGEASVVGYTWLFEKRLGQKLPDLSMLNQMEKAAQKSGMGGAGKRKVPDYIMENLTFPYTTGAEFVQKYQKKFGWEKVKGLFHDPPTSSTQILHPKKYWTEREEPLEIRMPLLASVIGADAKQLIPWGTHGEYNTQHVLRALGVSEADAASAALNWRGDRYQGLELKGGDVVVAWVSSWASEQDAEKFETVYRKALGKKLGEASRLERRGTEVVYLDNVKDKALREKLWRACWSVEKATVKRESIGSLLSEPPVEDFAPGGIAGGTTDAKPRPETVKRPVETGPALGPKVDDQELGLTFVLPAKDFEKVEENVKDLRPFSRGKWTRGETTLRVLDLPLPFDPQQIATQFEQAVRQGIKNFKKTRDPVRGTIAGRQLLQLDFEGEIPGYGAGRRAARACAVEREGTTLVFLLDTPAGKLDDELPGLERALAHLEVETGPLKGERVVGKRDHLALSATPSFVAQEAAKPIVLRLEDGKGASIMVQELAGSRSLDDEAQATEAFLERGLTGYKRLGLSEVVRDGRRALILDYEADADAGKKRVRMMIQDESGQRATLALSAPSDTYDSYRGPFERAVSTFRLGSGAAGPAAPAKPDAPAGRKGKLY